MSDQEQAEAPPEDSPENGAESADAVESPKSESESKSANDEASKANAGSAESPESDATNPEFQELNASKTATPGQFELSRFSGVQVVLTAELGRAHLTLEELMGLGEGTVMELDREIGAPVELIAQGVSVGNGEVVVIEDRFAIRIKQIYQNN